jgi:hypothetical protein
MMVFFDPKLGRGGGQVVLEDLLTRLVALGPVGLVMPDAGRAAISLPEDVMCWSTPTGFVEGPPPGPLVLVANANASLFDVWRSALMLTRRGMDVRTAAIIHNYPSHPAKQLATVNLLQRMDLAIAVEPGLCRLRPDSVVPAWLSVTPRSRVGDHAAGIQATGVVKSYARPDPSKGMHLLAELFPRLTAAGITCQVALGDALDGQVDYERRLRRQLAPWLVDGKRNAAWIDPGDVFVVPSVAGEAACLAAQEAMSTGAFVVASRVGLMPYLSPESTGVRTFPIANVDWALREITGVLALDSGRFSAECLANVAAIESRSGRWQEETLELLSRLVADPRQGSSV